MEHGICWLCGVQGETLRCSPADYLPRLDHWDTHWVWIECISPCSRSILVVFIYRMSSVARQRLHRPRRDWCWVRTQLPPCQTGRFVRQRARLQADSLKDVPTPIHKVQILLMCLHSHEGQRCIHLHTFAYISPVCPVVHAMLKYIWAIKNEHTHEKTKRKPNELIFWMLGSY